MAQTPTLKVNKIIDDPELEELIGMEIANVVKTRIAGFQGAEMAAITVAQDPDVKRLIAETLRQTVEETGTPQLQDIDKRIQRIYEIKAQRVAMEAVTAQTYLSAAQAATAPKAGTSKYPPVILNSVQPGDLIKAGTFNQLVQAIRNHDDRLRALEGGIRGDSGTDDVTIRVLNKRIEALEKRLDDLTKAQGGTKTPVAPPPPAVRTPNDIKELEKKYREELIDPDRFRERVFEKNQKFEMRELPKERKSIFDKGNIDPSPEEIIAEIDIRKGTTETEVIVDIPKSSGITEDTANEVVFGGFVYKGDAVIRETKPDGSLTLTIDTAKGNGTQLKDTELLKTPGFELRGGTQAFGASEPIISGFGRFGPT
jgi:hypothetical protein